MCAIIPEDRAQTMLGQGECALLRIRMRFTSYPLFLLHASERELSLLTTLLLTSRLCKYSKSAGVLETTAAISCVATPLKMINATICGTATTRVLAPDGGHTLGWMKTIEEAALEDAQSLADIISGQKGMGYREGPFHPQRPLPRSQMLPSSTCHQPPQETPRRWSSMMTMINRRMSILSASVHTTASGGSGTGH